MSNLLMTIPLLLVLLINITIPILIGVYVYKDASKRDMNAVVWLLISVLVPMFVGFVIYLLIRANYSAMKCPVCNQQIKEDFIVCPNCKTKLRPTCPACNTLVNSEWKVCPKCATDLPLTQDVTLLTSEKPPKDKFLNGILWFVIAIPLLILLSMVLNFTSFSSTQTTTLTTQNEEYIESTTFHDSRGTSVMSLPIDDYLENQNNTEINSWLEGANKDLKTAYTLKHQTKNDDTYKTYYLVYLPIVEDKPQIAIKRSDGLFSSSIMLDIKDTDKKQGNTLILIVNTGDDDKLKIEYAGEKIDLDITEVSYPLGLK